MAKRIKTTDGPSGTVRVIHGPSGKIVNNTPAPRPAGEHTIPRDKFRESAERVLVKHKRALEWLKDK